VFVVTIREQEALRLVREAASEAAAAGGLPDFLAELERARAEAILSALVPSKAADRLLSVREAADKLGRSTSWIYKNRRALPVVRFPTGGFAFRSEALDTWIRSRSS
jgi:predicted DNA-binding transcriptional regulator AlpA